MFDLVSIRCIAGVMIQSNCMILVSVGVNVSAELQSRKPVWLFGELLWKKMQLLTGCAPLIHVSLALFGKNTEFSRNIIVHSTSLTSVNSHGFVRTVLTS